MARTAPESPGVYLWKDENAKILYIGKARSLKDRISSYFSSGKDVKTRHLVSKASSLEWILTETEYEALLLESNLIKVHHPKYNINLKDGKTYPSIRITNDDFPRVFRTRRIINDGSRYFGPYPSAEIIDRYLELVRRLFPIRRCVNMKRHKSPCIYYHIGRCAAPCVGKITKEEYAAIIDRVVALLSGDTRSLADKLREEMLSASEALEFEKAATLRDSLAALDAFQGESGIIDFDEGDRDYIAWEADASFISFVVFQVREGKLVGRDLYRERFFSSEADAATSFISTYYDKKRLPPPAIYVHDSQSLELAELYLKRELGAEAVFTIPDEKRHEAAIAMARHNAREDIVKRRRELGDVEALEGLRELLGLDKLPELIIGFDIAHLAGKNTVASMVVFRNGAPEKKSYRVYKIRSLGSRVDDYAAMREVAARHFTRVANGEAEVPDMVLVDGGRGQVNAAFGVMDALGLDLPLAGLAEKDEEIWPHAAKKPLILPRDSKALRLLIAVRDEAHRFANGMNRRLRGKEIGFPVLEAVKGIGPRKAGIIMDRFGSLEAVAEAEPEYLAKSSGITKPLAELVKAAARKALDSGVDSGS